MCIFPPVIPLFSLLRSFDRGKMSFSPNDAPGGSDRQKYVKKGISKGNSTD